MTKQCPTCKGRGILDRPTMSADMVSASACEPCQGSGRIPMTDAEAEASGQTNLLED